MVRSLIEGRSRIFNHSAAQFKGGVAGHKSCLLVHIRANTEHYYHGLKPGRLHSKGACPFSANTENISNKMRYTSCRSQLHFFSECDPIEQICDLPASHSVAVSRCEVCSCSCFCPRCLTLSSRIALFYFCMNATIIVVVLKLRR